METECSWLCLQEPATVDILSQMSPVHNFSSYLSKIHSNIILPSTSRLSKLSLTFRFSKQNFVHNSQHPMRAIYIVQLILPVLST